MNWKGKTKFLSIFELDALNIKAELGFLLFLCGTMTHSKGGSGAVGGPQQLPMQPKRWEQRTM